MEKKDKNKELRRERVTSGGHLCVREAAEGESGRVIEGYAILFNTPSDPLWEDDECTAREVISPNAVTRDLLDASDIKFTMFHDRQIILARSNRGSGSLKYEIDERGVKFEFEAPNTSYGDYALEAVKRGDIAGCSFAFTTRYWDRDCVARSTKSAGGHTEVTYTVNTIFGIHDMTLAADPAYPDTSVSNRELMEEGPDGGELAEREKRERVKAQVSEMRRAAVSERIDY